MCLRKLTCANWKEKRTMSLLRKLLSIALYLTLFVSPLFADGSSISSPQYMWYRNVQKEGKDYYVAFRGQWSLYTGRECDIQILGASWFVVWLDGHYYCEGPARFPEAYPQYQTFKVHLTSGRHVLAIEVHQIGQVTRQLDNPMPFLFCVVRAGARQVPVEWKCIRLEGYQSQVRRINPELSYIEWCDTRQLPVGWKKVNFDDSAWQAPLVVTRKLGELEPLSIANPKSVMHQIKPIGSGVFVNRFGYPQDDPPTRFFLCNLHPHKTPPSGVWRLYDLGRVRLMQPRFTLDLPPGTVVEFAYSEELVNGRVTPWITLSSGLSANMDHYVARGGRQVFFPLTPCGGRFLEVHIYAPPKKVHFIKQEIVERCYFGKREGYFQTTDTLLNRIWLVGVKTLRACSEDALIDNPTREQGQWMGDVFDVGMNIAGSAFSDLRLIRRGLVQAAECARADGLVAGLCPGGRFYLSAYAAQWVTVCVHYWEMTGDLKLLTQLFPYAERNIAAFERQTTDQGVKNSLGIASLDASIDWGYVSNPGPCDMATNLFYLEALRNMVHWCNAIGKRDRSNYYRGLARNMVAIIRNYYASQFRKGKDAWDQIGYQRAVLGLRLGFFSGKRKVECIKYIKDHMLQCFPNDPAAPRLSSPEVSNTRLITPYFDHFALPVLIRNGQMNFVLDQYRKCWGWALRQGLTTWPEVFDLRWSHCHAWAGCPTWQMSRYLLGLRPRYDLGTHNYVLDLYPGSLKGAKGAFPLPGKEGIINIRWSRSKKGLNYHLVTPVPITLHINRMRYGYGKSIVQIKRVFDATFKNFTEHGHGEN